MMRDTALCEQPRSCRSYAGGKWFASDVLAISGGIRHPAIDGGLAPAPAVLADLDLPRKRPFAHFAVDRGPAKACPVKHCAHAKDFFRLRHFGDSIGC